MAQSLEPRPRDFTTGIFKFGTTQFGDLPSDADLARTISEGLYWSSMYPYGKYSDKEVADLVEYVKALSRKREPKTGAWIYPFEAPRRPLQIPDAPPDTQASRQHGKELYDTTCMTCHGETGKGDGPAAATVVDVWGQHLSPRDLTIPVYKAGSTARDVFVIVTRGIPGTPMAPMPTLSQSDRWAIGQYVVSLQQLPKEIAAKGEALYRAYGCVSCHGPGGKGGMTNPNAVKGTVPALSGLSERLFLFDSEDIDAFIAVLDAGKDPRKIDDPPDIPRWPAVAAQYDSVRKVISGGAQSAKKQPAGPEPPLSMPAWEAKLSPENTNAIIAYLLALGHDGGDDE